MLQNSLGIIYIWNCKINGIKNKVRHDKRIKEINMSTGKAFAFCLSQQCLA